MPHFVLCVQVLVEQQPCADFDLLWVQDGSLNSQHIAAQAYPSMCSMSVYFCLDRLTQR